MNEFLRYKRNENICCICLESSAPDILSLCCGCVIHSPCYFTWVAVHHSCPCCLHHLKTIDIKPIECVSPVMRSYQSQLSTNVGDNRSFRNQIQHVMCLTATYFLIIASGVYVNTSSVARDAPMNKTSVSLVGSQGPVEIKIIVSWNNLFIFICYFISSVLVIKTLLSHCE